MSNDEPVLPDDGLRWLTVQQWQRNPDAFRAWCGYVDDLIGRFMFTWPATSAGSDDDQRAALVARAALRYLATPPTEERVMMRRPSWKGEEARWIEEANS